MAAPQTRYVSVAGSDVAYQVLGEGPGDLLYSYGLGGHVDVSWESPLASAFMERLASFSRLIMFDRRGTGASDGLARGAFPTWEQWTDDMLAVLDAAGSERAAVFATMDAGPIAILFASLHPERVSALILLTTAARFVAADDYPIGISNEVAEGYTQLVNDTWGTPEFAELFLPSMSENREYLNHVAKRLRGSATPRTAAMQFEYLMQTLDVRYALPLVQAPTLILHVSESPFLSIEHGRYLEEQIPGARFIALAGGETGVSGDDVRVSDAIAEFLTGELPAAEVDRVLTTVLFSDIVASTERAASLGDRRWRALLDAHDRTVREQLRRHRGREINTTGDGFVAAFDGPARAIRCGQALVAATHEVGLEVRVGLHTGECEVRDDDLGGLAVHIAARVAALAEPSEVVVSGTVKDLVVGSDIRFADRGEHDLKGVPGQWRVFAAIP